MGLKQNIEYWKISLQNPEPELDEYYVFDELVVKDEKLIQRVQRLRELITSYCVVLDKYEDAAKGILDEIYEIITSMEKIQYTEFVAYWKVLDMSFSVFGKLEKENQKNVLAILLKEYCLSRRPIYEKLGYSNVTVQALYDSGASRKKGIVGIDKILDLAKELDVKPLVTIEDIGKCDRGYFLPDKGNQELFEKFCSEFKISYEFGKNHQGKYPDVVLKVSNRFFIIEAKHIKEPGGAQDKQIVELIEFIKYSEKSEKLDCSRSVHYVSFMDGVYFNNFINPPNEMKSKVTKQKDDIEEQLKNNPNNFFVNTAGLKELLKDLKE